MSTERPPLTLAPEAPMAAFQKYVHDLEEMHGWLSVDLVHNCFLMGEEVGELFKAVRKHERLFEESAVEESAVEESAVKSSTPKADVDAARAHVGEEIVDVLNYLLAIANRLEIDVEDAFRNKNERNQKRTWS